MVQVLPKMVIEIVRDGCNNDDSGRTDHDWDWHLWKIDDLLADIQHEKDISEDEFECKVLGKMKSYRELAEHRERMLNRALTWNEFNKRYSWSFRVWKGYEVLSPIEKMGTYTIEQIEQIKKDDYWYFNDCGRLVLSDYLENKTDIIRKLWSIETGVKHCSGGHYVHKRSVC